MCTSSSWITVITFPCTKKRRDYGGRRQGLVLQRANIPHLLVHVPELESELELHLFASYGTQVCDIQTLFLIFHIKHFINSLRLSTNSITSVSQLKEPKYKNCGLHKVGNSSDHFSEIHRWKRFLCVCTASTIYFIHTVISQNIQNTLHFYTGLQLNIAGSIK